MKIDNKAISIIGADTKQNIIFANNNDSEINQNNDQKVIPQGKRKMDHGDGSVGPFLVVLTIISGSQSLRARNDCSTNN